MDNTNSHLSLKLVDISDHDFLFKLYNLSDKRENRPSITKESNKKFVNDFVENKKNHIFDSWYIIKFDQNNIGSVTLRKDTNDCGYWIVPEFQNKGIGTNAIQQFMDINKKSYYTIRTHIDNKRSQRITEKLKFTLSHYEYRLEL